MTPAQLTALRSRIASEPAGPWLDCIVAQFALEWKWIDSRVGEQVACLVDDNGSARAGRLIDGRIKWSRVPPTSTDHNACFAALAALEKRDAPIFCQCRRFFFYSKRPTIHAVELNEKGGEFREWVSQDEISLPLAAARAIALAAVDNGVLPQARNENKGD